MSERSQTGFWYRWVHQPQKIWLRRVLFQVHLWSGIAVALYIFVISVTGSILVYRNELDRAATRAPVISRGPGPPLTDDQIREAATRAYPGYRVLRLGRPLDPDQAVDLWLGRGDAVKKRMFDARSGRDLGNSVPTGIWVISRISDLHDDLFAGPTGRKVNGIGALVILAVAVTGIVVWWPGIKTWPRSLFLHRGGGWKRLNWHLHSMIGFWSLGFTLIFGLSGFYLGMPQPFVDLADRLEPADAANTTSRISDQVIYWLAYLHFGRIGGIGIPCKGPGLCDQATKAVWAMFGLAPAAMVVTGIIMWWNRVLRPRLAKVRQPVQS
jgi:uncharacterized iron-regulated membrane protein